MCMQADSQRHRDQASEDREEHRRWLKAELFGQLRQAAVFMAGPLPARLRASQADSETARQLATMAQL